MFGAKTFKYTTPILTTLPEHLNGTRALASQFFHTLCDPNNIETQIDGLSILRNSLGLKPPFIIWEPAPLCCKYSNLKICLDSLHLVDVFSPNHLELLGLFGHSFDDFSKAKIEELSLQIIKAGVGGSRQGAVVIRAGEMGCFLASAGTESVWLPSFYDARDPSVNDKIKDTTGAGNAFLGGFAVGFSETKNLLKAACYGTISASFMLEQIGPPHLDSRSKRCDVELWNGEEPRYRLKLYEERISNK